MIYYSATPLNDVAQMGQLTVSAANKKKYNQATYIYTLGKATDGTYAYTDDPAEMLPDYAAPVTLDEVADRITVLASAPPIYNRLPQLITLAQQVRDYVPPVVACPVLGAAPLPQTPLPPKSGSLASIPGLSIPRNGLCYSGGEFSSPGYVGKNTNWDPFIAAGATIMRLPIRYNYFAPGGEPDPYNSGHNLSGDIDTNLISQAAGWAKYLTDRGVMVIFEDHSSRDMTNNDIAQFWAKFDVAFKAACVTRGYPTLPSSPLIIYGLQNEPSSKVETYGQAVVETVHGLRASGVTATLGLGWGYYNKPSYFPQYVASIEAAGGVANLDPLNRVVFFPHHYWEPSGNDTSGKVSGGLVIADAYASMLATARQYGLTLVFEEIGLGGGTPGWLPSDGKGAGKNGEVLFNEYVAWARANTDVVKGTVAWGGGRFPATYSYHIDLTTPQGKALAGFWKP